MGFAVIAVAVVSACSAFLVLTALDYWITVVLPSIHDLTFFVLLAVVIGLAAGVLESRTGG